jgi:hypothetical protein
MTNLGSSKRHTIHRYGTIPAGMAGIYGVPVQNMPNNRGFYGFSQKKP